MRGKRSGYDPGLRLPATLMSLAAALASGGGCSDDAPGRRPISGNVALDGRPLVEGRILLEPAPGDPSGTIVGGKILRGRFSVPRREGPTPGAYRVRIYASSRSQSAPVPGQSARAPRPMIELIPARYNRSTTLGATVAAEGENEYRFELRSAPDPGDA